MSHFDERSGLVYCSTKWGQWAQTIEEVYIEVEVADGTKSRDIRCDLTPSSISVTVSQKLILKVSSTLHKFYLALHNIGHHSPLRMSLIVLSIEHGYVVCAGKTKWNHYGGRQCLDIGLVCTLLNTL